MPGQRRAEDVGQRVRRIGGQQQGAAAGSGGGDPGGSGQRRLTDAALAGEQAGAQTQLVRRLGATAIRGAASHPSTLLRSSFSAVSRIDRSALRRSGPISGMVGSMLRL